jgi:hypothetical protein
MFILRVRVTDSQYAGELFRGAIRRRRLDFDCRSTELQLIVRIQEYARPALAIDDHTLRPHRGQQQMAARGEAQDGVLWIDILVRNLQVLIGSTADGELFRLECSAGDLPAGGRRTSGDLAYEADQHRLTSTGRLRLRVCRAPQAVRSTAGHAETARF